VQREARDAGCRACSLSKKFDERSFFWQRVLVGKDANDARVVKRFQHNARGFILVNWPASAQAR